MSKQVEQLKPIREHSIGMYACGFTVYDYTHIGHLRKYTMDDVLVKTLRHFGYSVNFVQNVTDVGHLASDGDTGEDKLEKGAKKYGKSVWDIAHEFEEYFFRSMDLMGNVRPDISCRATEHIQEQLNMVLELESKGYTYVIEGDGVYFDTSKLDDYGKLAGLKIEDLLEGARVEMVVGKRNPSDFALWKFEREGENRAMVWESPWSKRSFPGWHIECSAMAIKYLGEQFDIHTGGIDHIPVHHTNEIAQAESMTGKKPFVKYWVHHNHLHINGEKMSKSLGNFYTIDDMLKKGINPRALRLLFLTTHYRSEMNFTWESIAGIQKSYEKLVRQVQQFKDAATDETSTQLSAQAESYREQFYAYLSNDLSTSEAIAVVWSLVKSDVSPTEKLMVLKQFDEILSLDLLSAQTEVIRVPDEVQQLLDRRQTARENNDWQLSDELRESILKKGYIVEDVAAGQTVKKV